MKTCVKCAALFDGKRCEECHRADSRKRYAANKERWIVYTAKRVAEHRDDVNAAKRKYRATAKGHEKVRQDNERFRALHPTYQLEWTRANPDKARVRTSKYRAKLFSAFGSHTESEWQAIKTKQRDCCAQCARKAALEQDHIVPITRGGSDMAVNIQGLCRSCNARKSNAMLPNIQLSVFDRVVL